MLVVGMLGIWVLSVWVLSVWVSRASDVRVYPPFLRMRISVLKNIMYFGIVWMSWYSTYVPRNLGQPQESKFSKGVRLS